METTIYLIRHAQAEANRDGCFNGHLDGRLTDTGYRQLEDLAKHSGQLKLDAVYSSPLCRALETAQAVNRGYGYEIQRRESLKEINGGSWEGKTWEEIRNDDGALYQLWEAWHKDFQAPGGEKLSDVYWRMKQAILDIVMENRGKTVGVVSHGCAIMCFTAWAQSLPPDKINEVALSGNTGISKIIFDRNLWPSVIWQNHTGHLREELKTGKTIYKGTD